MVQLISISWTALQEEGGQHNTKFYIPVYSGLFLSHSSALFSFGHGDRIATQISPLTLPDEKIGGKCVIYLDFSCEFLIIIDIPPPLILLKSFLILSYPFSI